MPRPSRSGVGSRLARFWHHEEKLSVLLALLILFAFVVPPLAPRDGQSGILAPILFSLVLITGMTTVMRHRPWAGRAVIAITVVALPLRWAASVDPSGPFAVWSAAAETISLVALALVVLATVLAEGTVTRYRLEGAVAAYLLLGLAWAGAYEWVALSDASAFVGAGIVGGGSQQWNYYSLVTLTTMGYGDILPVSAVARSLATAEAFTGQLYLAILISRLVALELQAGQAK
jgi:hypothetical protein